MAAKPGESEALLRVLPPEPRKDGLGIARDVLSMVGFLLIRAHRQDRWGRLRAWSWLAAMVAAATLHGRAFIEFTVVQAGSINAVKDFDKPGFWLGRSKMFLVILKLVATSCCQNYAAEKIKKIWRSALTSSMLRTYMSGTYYRSKLLGTVTNPDHRITSDVDSIVEDVTNLAKMFPEHATNIVGLTRVMWASSRAACVLLWSYAVGVTLVARKYFEKHTAKLEVAEQDVEAHLRFSLLHIQECAESIAFYNAAHVEESRLAVLVGELAKRRDQLLTFRCLFGSVERTFSWIASILPSLIMAPMYWQGLSQFADYSKMVNGFRKVKDALFFLADNFDKLGSISARVERVRELNDFAAGEKLRQQATRTISVGPCQGDDLLALTSVRVAVPGSMFGGTRWLGSHGGISVTLKAGDTLLIQGESGVGKSSLLRVIAGLWDTGTGSVRRVSEVFFLPQTPYIPAGDYGVASSLRDQLLYPKTEAGDDEIVAALHAVQLDALVGDLDVCQDWATVLSGGERERLVFGRLLLQLAGAKRPLVLVDEATSNCSEDSEVKLYEALLERVKGGAVVSVGHRSTLRKFHQEVIVLVEDSTELF